MPLFLEASVHRRGPDGEGWNRLSLNAHFDVRHQCGLRPINYPTLFESRTARQRWGGYERCPTPWGCSTCPVQALALEHRPAPWPDGTPLCLARVVPWPPTPGAVFADPAAGRSSLRLHAPDGTDTGTTLEWPALRNDYNIRISWSFRDAQGEAFWVVRGSTTADDAHVLSNPLPAGTRHVLHAAPDGRRLVTVTCPAPCAHEEWHLAHLAADLAGLAHDGEVPPGTVPQPPELRGTAVTLDHRPDGTSELRRHDSVTHFAWEVPVDRRTLTALAAHAVRTIAAA